MKDAGATDKLIDEVKPDWIFHLAAAFSNPDMTDWEVIHNNMLSEINLFEAIKKSGIFPRVLIAGSSVVYGDGNIGGETDEKTELKPKNLYGISKVGQDMIGYKYFAADKMDVIRVRPFNHAGARRGAAFVEGAFAKQIAEIEKSGVKSGEIKVGNLTPTRDWLDVRDVVEAYIRLMEKGVAGEVYNVCSSVSHSVQELLDTLISLSNVEVLVTTDVNLVRKNDDPGMSASNKKLKADTGWEQKYSFEDMCQSILDYWRKI
jgi:GDP-4-dehydro-6-deoxy-D-mannose reductase